MEKLEAMAGAAMERAKEAAALEAEIRETLASTWPRDARHKAPGSEIIDAVFQKYGLTYSKSKDAGRLARAMEPSRIDMELRSLMDDITRPDAPV